MIDRQVIDRLTKKIMIVIGILGTLLPIIIKDHNQTVYLAYIFLSILTVALLIDIVLYKSSLGISWLTIRRGVALLLKKFDSENFAPELIIGVGRAGSIIGGMLAANRNHCPFITLDVKHQTDPSGMRMAILNEPFSLTLSKINNKKILLAFAYVKTSLTLRETINYLTYNGVYRDNISCATIFLDPQCVSDLENMRNFYYAEIRSIPKERWEAAIPWSIKDYDWR